MTTHRGSIGHIVSCDNGPQEVHEPPGDRSRGEAGLSCSTTRGGDHAGAKDAK